MSPSPETTDVRERAARIIEDGRSLGHPTTEIVDLLARTNLLRTPDIAATGGASGEQALQDAHEEGYAEGLSDATGHASDVFKGVLSWLNDRDLLLPAEFPDGVTAQEIVDTLEEHEREIVASERALITAERERAEKAEQWAADWHSVVETILTVCGLSSALGGEEALAALRDHVTRLTEDLAARTGERDALAAQVYVPGQWVCAKCKFTLQQMVMSATEGSVAAHDKPGEPCPNCRSPLWRTTWKQEAVEMQERAIEQMEERKSATARADALQQRVGALEELLKAGLTAVSYAYEQAQAEYHGHDKRAGKFDVFIAGWRKATRTALSQTPTPNAKTEGV